MSYMAAGASNPRIKNVMSIDYLATQDDVLVTVNQTQLVGRYPNIDAAELAVEGILVKCGVKQLEQALARIPTIVTTSGGDNSSALNYVSFTTSAPQLGGISCTGSSYQINDITRPVVLSFTGLNTNRNIRVFFKKSKTSITANATIDPENDGYVELYENSNVVLTQADFTRLKAKWVGSVGTLGTVGTLGLVITNKETGFVRNITITATVE